MTDENVHNLVEDAKDTLVEVTEGGANALRRGRPDPHDNIFEVANGAVPVYTYHLITVFRSSPDLWSDIPDTGVGDDITTAISRVIFNHVHQALNEYVDELGSESIQCTVDDCGEDDDHQDTDGELCTDHCSACDECGEEEEEED